MPLKTLLQELRHESLATAQKYLADVLKPGEAKKAVADADFIPTPQVVSDWHEPRLKVSSSGASLTRQALDR